MDQNASENENSSDYEPIYSIDTINALFNEVNEISLLNPLNQSTDKQKIKVYHNFYNEEIKSKKCSRCNCNDSFNKFFDFIGFVILFFNIILQLMISVIFIVETAVSLYAVLIMCYVFFISSIISYTMAPLYSSLSHNWLNFGFSFAQVILASPLIAFYIYFIVKSIVSLGEIIQEIPKHIKKAVTLFSEKNKKQFIKFFSMVCSHDYKLIFHRVKFLTIIITFIESAFSLTAILGLGYVLFCLDKLIILIGGLDIFLSIIRISILLFPSYIYFIQTLFNIKSKNNNCVIGMIYRTDAILEKYNEKSSDSSTPSNSTDKIFRKLEESDDSNKSSQISSDSVIISSEFIDEVSMASESTSSSDLEYNLIQVILSILANSINIFLPIKSFLYLIQKIMSAKSFFPLYYYSAEIAFDRHKQFRKMMCMLIFFMLNLAVLIYDVIQLVNDYSDYLLSSIIVRFILVPLFSYFNIITVLYHRAKDKTLRIINYVSIIFTGVIVILVIACSVFVNIYQFKFRLQNLEYAPFNKNITIVNEKTIDQPICVYEIFDISAFDAFGYALGGYDIKRNKTIFDNQMKIFFGENYSSHISYTVYELDKYFLFLKYYDSSTNTHIFSFRGFNSGPEIAFQFELFASQYIIPFFEDNVPFLSFINENWLSFYTDFLNAFGLRFFENRNLIVKYVKSIGQIYDELNISENENVLFTGINCGGVIAKIFGTLLYKRSISFISFPIELDFLQNWFHYSLSDATYVTNVFNVDSFFSVPDTQYAINIGIETPVFQKSKFCTSDFCEIFSKLDNVYKTFCSMSEICGKGNQFNYYCQNTIGEKYIRIIRENLKDED